MRFLFSQRSIATTLATLTMSVLFFVLTAVPAYAEEADWFTSLANTAFKMIAELIHSVFIMIGGVVAGAGGQLLDISISLTILNMGDVYQYGIGFGIEALWMVIRDILNILFIFGLIFIGIKTILNSEDSGTRRALGLLIVSALLINFSLFITLAIIDFANVAAVQIYNQIINGAVGAGGVSTSISGSANGIAWIFVDIANLTSLFGGQDALKDLDAISIIAYAIFMLFFLLFAGIIFFMGAFLLMSRFVALVIYTIISPAMFLGWILPSLQEHSRKWWRGFIKQAFFAPAFLFMLYLAVVVLQRLNTYLTIHTNFFPAESGYANMMAGGDMFSKQLGLIFMFCMTIGFLYASMKVGQMMSVAGANTTMKMTNNALRGLRGIAYRNTVGLGVKAGSRGLLRGMDSLEQSMAKNEENSSRYGRLRRTANSFGRGIANATITSSGARKSLETARDYRGGVSSTSDIEKASKEQAERVAGGAKQIKLKEAIKNKLNTDPNTQQGMAASIALESALSDASASDLAKLAGSKEGLDQLSQVVGSIPEKKFESLMENKDLSPSDKARLGAGRESAIAKNLTRGGKTLQQGLGGASADELNALDFNTVMDNALYIQSGQIEKLGSKWGEEKMRIFKEKRKQDFEKKFSEGTAGIEEILTTRGSEKEIGKLPNELFTNYQKDFLDYSLSDTAKVKLTGSLMQHIAGESGINGTQKKALGAAIATRFGDSMPSDLANFFKSPAGGAFGVNLESAKKNAWRSTMDQSV